MSFSTVCLKRISASSISGWFANGSMPIFSRFNSTAFDSAVQRLESVSETDNHQKLKLYALYKQATVGRNTSSRPGFMELIKKAKWDAWHTLGDMSKEDAEKEYIKFVGELLSRSDVKGEEKKIDAGEGLKVTVKNGIRTILLNRPEKFNAMTIAMYDGIAQTLTDANDDPFTNIVVLTGSGKLFCSGNDLGSLFNVKDHKTHTEAFHTIVLRYVSAYIECRKPIIGLVNGPAIGIGVTVLGLMDGVYASDSATFYTPFSSLGQSPEGCSSYTFPRIMGSAKASELLYFNTKISAQQAKDWGLVSEVIPHDRFETEAWNKVNEVTQNPIKSIVYSKELVRGRERAILHEVNKAECDRLVERWQSDDCKNAIINFFSRKSKQ